MEVVERLWMLLKISPMVDESLWMSLAGYEVNDGCCKSMVAVVSPW